jgi:putative MFS transporter
MLAVLGIATLYDGFDSSMFSLASKDVSATLGISEGEWGTYYAYTRAGVIGSFFFLMCADRFGRRALLLFTVAGFALASLATAFVQNAAQFVIVQTIARLFLTAQYGLAVIIAGEELPASLRGRGITILTAAATLGTVTVSQLLRFFLLEGENPVGNPASDFAMGFVAFGSSWLGLASPDGEYWRGLYLIGVIPILFLPLFAAGVRETQRFAEVSAERARTSLAETFRAQFREARRLFEPQYLPRFRIVALLWNCVHFVTAPSVAYWALYARGPAVGLTPEQTGHIVSLAYVGGAVGHLLAGQLVDRLGRKLTCSIFYSIAAVAIIGLFHTTTMVGQYVWHIGTVFFFNCAIGATHVYASELFPTALRATGYGWATNLFGRFTEVGAPLLIAQLIPFMGVSWAITWVGIGPIVGALLVMKFAPETKGLTLEEIQQKLDAESKAGAVKAPA